MPLQEPFHLNSYEANQRVTNETEFFVLMVFIIEATFTKSELFPIKCSQADHPNSMSIFKQSHLGHTQSTLGHTQSRLGHTQSTLGHTDFRSKSHGIRFQSIWDGDPGDQAATLTRGLSSVKKVIEPGDQAASPNMYSCVGSSGSFRNLSDP